MGREPICAHFPIGPFGLGAVLLDDTVVVRLLLPGRPLPPTHLPRHAAPVLAAIGRYLAGERGALTAVAHRADVAGDFRRRVLAACAAIPPGQVLSYAALAAEAGNPRAARAAGTAMATNPIPLLVPCHRVVPSGGGVGHYGGGTELKRWLLRLEGAPLSAD
jgi:methylated-DNA-[protein]-cysteine S-methyltransferase